VLERGQRNLAVALHHVRVAGMEVGALDQHREISGGADGQVVDEARREVR